MIMEINKFLPQACNEFPWFQGKNLAERTPCVFAQSINLLVTSHPGNLDIIRAIRRAGKMLESVHDELEIMYFAQFFSEHIQLTMYFLIFISIQQLDEFQLVV
jgi:hypothetical protein